MSITKYNIEKYKDAYGLNYVVLQSETSCSFIAENLQMTKGTFTNIAHEGMKRSMTRTKLLNDKIIFGKENIKKHIYEGMKAMGFTEPELECLWIPFGEAMERLNTSSENNSELTGFNLASGKINKDDIILKIGVKMLTEGVLKHWGLCENPFNKFNCDIVEEFWNHGNYTSIIHQMVDAGKNGGFLAVVGPVGGGKTTCAEMAMVELEEEGITVIQPQCKTGEYAKPNSLNAAIINKLSSRFGFDEGGDKKVIPNQGEYTMAIVRTVLERMAEQGKRCALFIEEAHLLHNNTLKHLKQLKELTLRIGRKVTQLISIIMVGQEELEIKLHDLYSVREVGIRISDLKIEPIPPVDAMPYLAHKFRLAGVDWYKICEESLREELSFGRTMGMLTPQRLNVIASALLEIGAKMDVEKLTLQLYWDMLEKRGVSEVQIRVLQAANEKRKQLLDAGNNLKTKIA